MEEEILRAEAEGVLVGHSKWDRPIPDRQAFALVPRIPRIAHEPPVEVYVNARRRFVQRRTVEGEVELKAVRVGQPAIAQAEKEIVDTVEGLASDQQVEIAGGTEGRMRVKSFGDRRPLE